MQEQITARAHGIDTYTGQYRRDGNEKLIIPSFASLTGQVDFAIIKISEGWWVDPEFNLLWDVTAAPAPLRGIYHYQRSGVSWVLQADKLLRAMPPDCQFICLDVEKINNVMDRTFFADTSRILNYWKKNTDKKVFYYSGPDIYVNYMLPIMQKYYLGDQWYLDFDMWVAQWPFWKPSRSPENNPSLPKGMRGDWKILQYNDAGDKTPYLVYGSPDLDVFNGPVPDMRAWLGLSQIPLPSQPSEPPIVITPGSDLVETWFDGKVIHEQHHLFDPSYVTYHILKIKTADIADIVFDDHVAISSTTHFLERTGVDIAINGLDGFKTIGQGRRASTQLIGFAAYHGRKFGKLGPEETLFIDAANHFSLSRPVNIWTACSFPNCLIRNGIIQPIAFNHDQKDIRARTAIGINQDQTELTIVLVDGGDYWDKRGMNFLETADVLYGNGVYLGVLGDSGGSTTGARSENGKAKLINKPCGENPDGQRSIAIHMGIKLRISA
jgi:GH25 family lysozyme M1 (1,4-beta-N-acetylmuramidase)